MNVMTCREKSIYMAKHTGLLDLFKKGSISYSKIKELYDDRNFIRIYARYMRINVSTNDLLSLLDYKMPDVRTNAHKILFGNLLKSYVENNVGKNDREEKPRAVKMYGKLLKEIENLNI